MKKRHVIILFVAAALITTVACQKKSKFYKPVEKVILDKVMESINFGYGFDADVELDYVFPKNDRFAKDALIEAGLNKSLKKYKKEEAVLFFETMYRLACMYDKKIEKYKKAKDWKLYTHLTKYLYPPLKLFNRNLEKIVLEIDPSYKEKIDMRKKMIKKSLEKKDKKNRKKINKKDKKKK